MEITLNTIKTLGEYHKFGFTPQEYQWSRTYHQFEKDLETLEGIRMDDGYQSQIQACKMAQRKGIKVYLGITTGFIGKKGYMTWEEVRELSQNHIICNHSMRHQHLDNKTEKEIFGELKQANEEIERNIWKKVEYYCPTYNLVNDNIIKSCRGLGLKILDPVIPITNTYEI